MVKAKKAMAADKKNAAKLLLKVQCKYVTTRLLTL